jgi:L-histidine N-alpha-methyltransferase
MYAERAATSRPRQLTEHLLYLLPSRTLDVTQRRSPPEALANDVRRGLSASPRSLPPKWFYDSVGSALFDEICELPEYYLTRSERSILAQNADAIAERSGADELLEIGSGMARKTGLLLAALAKRVPRPRYLPFDISEAALEACARSMRAVVPSVIVDPLRGDFEKDLETLRVAAEGTRRMWAFLGSTIGNLDERAAPALLAKIASRMGRRDTFLLGVDLVKDSATLEAAYNDRAGVTARFNKNVLAVINRELDADFDLERFAHRAHFDVERARIEMHLESLVSQRVRIGALDLVVDFDHGERILTEISRKFTRETVASTLASASMRVGAWYQADDASFALVLAEADR